MVFFGFTEDSMAWHGNFAVLICFDRRVEHLLILASLTFGDSSFYRSDGG